MSFLSHRDPRPLSIDAPKGWRPDGLFTGNGAMALEVVVLEAPEEPPITTLRGLHKERRGRRATPVVVAVLWDGDRAAICGPQGDDVAVVTNTDRGQVERICDAALELADRHSAIRFLNQAFDQLDPEKIAGLRNEGLFALHELRTGVPDRSDWSAAQVKARAALSARGRQLVERLGFKVQSLPGPASVLVAKGTKVAVAIFLERPDEIEPVTPLYDGVSPVSYALNKADQENLDYVVISAGSEIRVYPVKPGVGTGRRGRTETFVALNLALLRDDNAAYLWLLASAEALAPGGSFTGIIEKSAEYAADLSARLRERVYQDVVPQLAKALVSTRRLRNPSAAKLAETYEMALLVLFRLLFVAYAEDKELLPLHTNARYREHSLKTIARHLLDAQRKGVTFGREDFYWTEVQQLWKAVDKGNREWGVPQYNGGLFASDEADSSAGAALSLLSLPDATFAPALAALLLDRTEDGEVGPIDFRSLGVREFGTIYEGLLESALSVAETDLTLHPRTGAYLPARSRDDVVVHEGEVYLHNASGARKSGGAYYTKAFAVEHLLDTALEPALDDHLARLGALYIDLEAGEKFFDFRVADIAMGSGHFLVAAVDRVERRLSNYLANRRLPVVMDELERLRRAAKEALGDEYAGNEIEDTQLLRRQIARRCIFGVDLNPTAVELARLSIWIHTFVPGLPLSFLDRNLIVGNSLVGIATFEEASEVLAGSGDLFSFTAAERLVKAREPIEKLGRLADATAAEVKQAKKLYEQARIRIQGEEALLTILTASRIDPEIKAEVEQGNVATRLEAQGDVFSDRLVRKAEKVVRGLDVLHFPIAFPEVFLGARHGFDVILGNPPWDKLHVEEHEFWARYYPGFRGLTQAERERELPKLKRARPDLVRALDAERERANKLRDIILNGPYPGMGSGHPDLYKAFCWRFWHLVAPEGGRIGVVLPRAVFSAKGSEEFRAALFGEHGVVDLTTLVNNRGWVFDEIHPQYSIALVALRRGKAVHDREVILRGPYADLDSYERKHVAEAARFPYTAVKSWTSSFAVPLFPSERSPAIFEQMRRSPRLDDAAAHGWSARPIQGDLNSTTGKPYMTFGEEPTRSYWPVYAGESFDLWTPDRGRYYATAEAKRLLEHLQDKRLASSRRGRGAWADFSPKALRDLRTLPCRYPRIAFRDVTRATDSRTVRVALVPPQIFLTHKAPFFVWPKGTTADEAFVLGVLSSLPLDWYARRLIEITLSFELLNAFPIPCVGRNHKLEAKVVRLAAALAAQDDRFAEWVATLDHIPTHLTAEEQEQSVAELDAAVALLYGLSESDLRHIFETFHEGWDYTERLVRVIDAYRMLKSLA